MVGSLLYLCCTIKYSTFPAKFRFIEVNNDAEGQNWTIPFLGINNSEPYLKTTEGYVQYIIEVFIISTHCLSTHTEIWILFLLGNNIASSYLGLV